MTRLFPLTGALWVAAGAFGQCEVAQLHGSQSDQKYNDLFGGAVAVHGDVLAIAEPGFNQLEGGVFVFRYDGAAWLQDAILQAPDPAIEDSFARLALEDDVLLVGAPGTSTTAQNQGAVHVFRYAGEARSWQYDTSLTPGTTQKGIFFGYSVAMDGTVALIGAPAEQAAHVFGSTGDGWFQEQILTNPHSGAQDAFGVSVGLRGSIALVGDPGNNKQGPKAGAAFVYRYDGAEWELEGELLASDPAPVDWFGSVVATDGEVAVVSAPKNEPGAVYVFQYDGDRWAEDQRLVPTKPAGLYPHFGDQVVIAADGSTIVVGAPEDQERGFLAGAVHVFRSAGDSWVEVAKITASDGHAGAQYGRALAIDGDWMVVGAGTDGDGKVYVYRGILGIDCNGNGVADACDIFEGRSPDNDGDGIPDECQIPGDVNGDGHVSVEDLIAVILSWGPCPKGTRECPADVNGDTTVDCGDLDLVLGNWTP